MENTEEVNEAHLTLINALGIDPDDTAMVWDIEAEGPSGSSLHVVLVEGERVILVSHGWGASGAHVDVRCYVSTLEPQQVTPEMLEIDRTISIFNGYGRSA